VLTDKNFELYEKFGFENLKQFKTKRLYKQLFSIKLSTLSDVFDWLNEISEDIKK